MADLLSELLTEFLSLLPLPFQSTAKSMILNEPLPPMPNIPSELLTEILSMLPVKSLLRFRSTSNSLLSLMDSYNFTTLHLKNFFNFNLIVRCDSDFYKLDFHNISIAYASNRFMLTSNSNRVTLFGSCNGLLCISKVPGHITFLNPNIRKYRNLPKPPLLEQKLEKEDEEEADTRDSICNHGFGFDPLTENYKLVRITSFGGIYHSEVILFTSKMNSWKVLPNIPYALYYPLTIGFFVKNSLHWVVSSREREQQFQPCLILALNLTFEIFDEVPLPEIDNETESCFSIDAAVLGECLCMIVNYQTTEIPFKKSTQIDVWVMKEYGSRDSWCKLFALVESCFNFHLKSLRPLCYSSDRSKVLLVTNHASCMSANPRKLFWYDLKSEQVTYVRGIPTLNEVMICAESLVPPSLPIDSSTR